MMTSWLIIWWVMKCEMMRTMPPRRIVSLHVYHKPIVKNRHPTVEERARISVSERCFLFSSSKSAFSFSRSGRSRSVCKYSVKFFRSLSCPHGFDQCYQHLFFRLGMLLGSVASLWLLKTKRQCTFPKEKWGLMSQWCSCTAIPPSLSTSILMSDFSLCYFGL